MTSEENPSDIPESADWKTKGIERIREWNQQFYLWKTFDQSELKLIKSYVGLTFFGKPKCNETSTADIDFETVFLKYDDKERNTINEITDKFQFDYGQLRLSHTLLYLSKNDWQICLFRQMRSNGEIHFIDFNGRVYTSWKDFVENNKLPKCQFMAPKDGIHDLGNDEVEIHETPASSIVGTVCDYVACGATITSVGLGIAAVAPAIALGLFVGGTIFGVRQSVNTLVDRKKHQQSIAPTNLESVNCYMNIGTSFICSGSAIACLKKAGIIELSGKYSSLAASTIKGVHYTAAATAFTNAGLSLYIMVQKFYNNELHWSDWVDLCYNLFVIYGTVSNVREMRAYFSNSNPSPPKGLSKSARRRWRKRQSNLSTVTGSSGNQNVTKVGAWDPELFNFMLRTTGTISGIVVCNHFPSLHEIYNNVCLIIEDCYNFYLKRINLEVFCRNIFKHGQNLLHLLKNNSEEIKDTVVRFLQRCGIIASPESITEISNIIDDGVIAINNANEESTLDGDSRCEDEAFPTDCIFFEIILDLVKHRICRSKVNTTEDLFLLFTQELSSVTNEISSKVIQEYEDMLSFNIRMMGEKKAKIVLSQMGINSKNDFASTRIRKIIEILKTDDQVNVSISFQKQLDEILVLYRDLFRMVADENDISSVNGLGTCEILNNSIELVIQPLLELFKKSKEIYEVNIQYFDRKSALIFVLAAFDLNPNDITLNGDSYTETMFIDIARKKLNLCEIIPQLLPVKESTIDLMNDSIHFTDDFKIESLLNICNFYVQKIGSKEMTKIYSFITDKFTNHFQSLVNQQKESIVDVTEKLKSNIGILGESNFNKMCRFVCETDRFEIFNEVVEMFKKENFVVGLISEYNTKMHHITDFHAEYLKHLMADDGATIYTINIVNRNDIEELKQRAINLFNLIKYRINVVSKTESLVILKHANKYVAFQFTKNETETLVIQIDLSKKNEENE